MALDHRARAKGDEATHSARSWETKGSYITWYIVAQRYSRDYPILCWWLSWTPPPSGCPHSPLLHTTMIPCIVLVMPFSRDTLTNLSMTLVHLSGAKNEYK